MRHWIRERSGFTASWASVRGIPTWERLARGEEQKIAKDPRYRTPRKTLKRLAEAHVFYELERSGNGQSASRGASVGAKEMRGPWDTFSTRNLGLRVNRLMAREFGGDATRITEDSVKRVTRALGVGASDWEEVERHSLEDWSLILAMVPGLRSWSAEEKREMAE